MPKLTIEQRRDELEALLLQIPGRKNIDKVRWICDVLKCDVNTVRIWRLRTANSTRAIPERQLAVLKDRLKMLQADVLKPVESTWHENQTPAAVND